MSNTRKNRVWTERQFEELTLRDATTAAVSCQINSLQICVNLST